MSLGATSKSGWAALLLGACVLLSAGSAAADTIPLDPRAGVAGGGLSTPIFGTTFTFVLQLCGQEGSPAECTSGPFTNPQAVFAGQNLSAVPWTNITVTLNLPNPLAVAQAFTCEGGTLFTMTDCPAILPVGTTSVTFSLSKGTGTGIGCFDPLDSDPANTQCLINSIAVLTTPGSTDPYYNPNVTECPEDPREVCGPSHFVIAVGFSGDVWPQGSIPTGGTAVVPEPSTMALMLAGLGTLALRTRRKRPNARG